MTMWTCAQLRKRAKVVLKPSYWNGVVANMIIYGITAGIYLVVYIIAGIFLAASVFSSMGGASSASASIVYMVLMFSMLAVVYVVVLAASVFVTIPLTVGLVKFFLANRLNPPNFNNIFFAFKKGTYLKVVGSMLWMALFSMLWSLPYMASYGGIMAVTSIIMPFYLKVGLLIFLGLLLICSIVLLVYKTISYAMTPYILSDNPAIGFRRALKLSIAMTKGQIGHIFLLGLSFIGWILLGILACIIGLLFLLPYLMATFAELYAALRDNALRTGLCSFAELNFAEPDPGFFGGVSPE